MSPALDGNVMVAEILVFAEQEACKLRYRSCLGRLIMASVSQPLALAAALIPRQLPGNPNDQGPSLDYIS